MSPKIVTCFLKMWPGFLKKWPGFLIRGLLNFMENQVLGSHFWESGSHFWETGSHFWETGSHFWETGSPIRIRSHSWDTIGNPFHKFQVISEKPGHIFRRLAVTLFLNLKFHILLTWWVLQYDLELISIIKKSKIKFKYPFKDKRPLRNICKTIYIYVCPPNIRWIAVKNGKKRNMRFFQILYWICLALEIEAWSALSDERKKTGS